jgi:hypothetical protein
MQRYVLKSEITEFLTSIHASNDFKNSCRQVWSRNSSNQFKEIFCYNQLKDDISKCFNKFIVNSNSDYYITKNSFYANKRKIECLFSLDNIVIDIDNHNDTLSIDDIDFNVRKLMFLLSFDYESFFPFPSLVAFTGRGCQLWLHIDSISSKLLFLYQIVTRHFCDVLSDIIRNNDIDLSVDYTASLNAAALVRLPCSFNSVTHSFVSVEVYGDCYNIDDLISEYDISKNNVNSVKSSSALADETASNKNDYRNLLFKRIKFIERYCELHNFNLLGHRNNLLFLYYNCCKQVYSNAVERTEQLNNKFIDSLKDLSYIYNTVDKHIYKFTDSKFMDFMELSEVERNMYSHSDRDEKRKISKEERNKQIYQLAVSGVKQSEIAENVGCSVRTVKTVLKDFDVSEFRAMQARHLYKTTTMSKEEIASSLNVTLKTVYNYLKQL